MDTNAHEFSNRRHSCLFASNRGSIKRKSLCFFVVVGCLANFLQAASPDQNKLDQELIARARGGDVAQVKALLDKGADPNARGGIARPLQIAASGGRLEMMKALIDHGANVNGKSPTGGTALHAGAIQGGVDVVRFLLARGADPKAANDRGETPLHMAVTGDALIENVRMMLKAGANPNTRNKELVSPIRLAAIRGNIPAYQLLLEASGGKEQKGVTPKNSTAHKSDKTTRALIVDTASKDYETRKQAMLALVARGGQIMPEVIQALDTPGERYWPLFDVLAKLGPEAEAALPQLAALLPDKRYVVASRLTIDRIKPGRFAQLPAAIREQAEAALYEAVTDPNSRQEAGYFAYLLSEPSKLKLLRSREPELRAIAVGVISGSDWRSEKIEAELIKILLANDEKTSLRARAVRALGRSNKLSAAAQAALLLVVKASPPFGKGGQYGSRNTRLQTLSKTAGRALGTAGPSVIDDLLPLLSPLDNHLRPGAMEALYQLGSAGVPRLIELLAHQDEAIAISASIALRRLGRPALPALTKALESENEQVIEQALLAIGQFGRHGKQALPAILTIIRSENQSDSIRITAARAALQVDPNDGRSKEAITKALPAFIRIFAGQDGRRQLFAADALRQLGSEGEPALPALLAFLEKDESRDNQAYYLARRAAQLAIDSIEKASRH